MKKENTAIRLKKIMSDQNLRQVDILNKTVPYCEKYGVKMNKSDISQYCSGKTEPNQDKLFVLGMALDVNEAWLMGYDVPMERNQSSPIMQDINNEIVFESHLKLIGWTYNHVTFTDGLNCNECLERQAVKLGFEPESKYPDGNYEPFCSHCRMHDDYYVFTNGKISFNVSNSDFKLFINDSDNFYKHRIQSLLNKYSLNLFTNKNSNGKEGLLSAAHPRTDIGYSSEEAQSDLDMMSDENF